jgi:hypothetical protein
MFAYSVRTDAPICTKFGMIIPWEHEEMLERSRFQKNVLSSSPDSLARKLGTTEQQGKGQSCLFRQRDYRKEGHKLEKVSSLLAPVKVDSLAPQLSST